MSGARIMYEKCPLIFDTKILVSFLISIKNWIKQEKIIQKLTNHKPLSQILLHSWCQIAFLFFLMHFAFCTSTTTFFFLVTVLFFVKNPIHIIYITISRKSVFFFVWFPFKCSAREFPSWHIESRYSTHSELLDYIVFSQTSSILGFFICDSYPVIIFLLWGAQRS